MPSAVGDCTDQRLDQEVGDRARQVEERELVPVCTEGGEEGVHRGPSEVESELNSKRTRHSS